MELLSCSTCSRREGATLQSYDTYIIKHQLFLFYCFRMRLLTSDVKHIAWTFSLMRLYRKFPSLSPNRSKPPFIILLRRFRYVTSNFPNWLKVKFQFLHEYVSLLRTKQFRDLTMVLRWILEFWRRLAMAANVAYAIWMRWLISMSPVLGSFWEIYEPR